VHGVLTSATTMANSVDLNGVDFLCNEPLATFAPIRRAKTTD